MKFYLGLHQPSDSYKLEPWIPYMVSVRRLLKRKKPLYGDWLMDSAGFTEILKHGKYKISEEEYIDCIEKLKPPKAFCQDWMCEPVILERTGKTLEEHQELTIKSYLSMQKKVGDKVVPVLQGWQAEDYIRHITLYEMVGVNFNQLFGLGTVCSRSTDLAPATIIEVIKKIVPQIKLHGFGLKVSAFRNSSLVQRIESADSMAWCYSAWRSGNNSNSLLFALKWREKILKLIDDSMTQPKQRLLL